VCSRLNQCALNVPTAGHTPNVATQAALGSVKSAANNYGMVGHLGALRLVGKLKTRSDYV